MNPPGISGVIMALTTNLTPFVLIIRINRMDSLASSKPKELSCADDTFHVHSVLGWCILLHT